MIGLYALITGKFLTSQKGAYVVRGWPARIIGIVGLLPIPLSFLVGMAVAALLGAQGKPVTRASFFWVGTAIEGSIVVVCIVAMVVLSRVCRTPAGASELSGRSRPFRAPWPALLEGIDGALHDLGAKSVEWTEDRRRVSARIGASLSSWGERLTVHADESGEVRVSSVCAFPLQVIDWGKNAENCRKFLARLTDRLESEAQG